MNNSDRINQSIAGSRQSVLVGLLAACCMLAIVYLLNPAISHAAPHITKAKPEPVVRPGTHLSQRLAAKFSALNALRSAQTTTGTVNVLFLRVQFVSKASTTFEANLPTNYTGSGRWGDTNYAHLGDPNYWVDRDAAAFVDYYREASYGKLNLVVNVSSSIYELPHKMSYYGDETYAALDRLINDSIRAADPDIDFALYDAVLIVHAGAGEESDVNSNSPYDLWSLYYSGATSVTTSDSDINGRPITISEAIIMPQTDSQDDAVVDPLGVYVHEFGHWLGLPDLYCTATFCVPDGVGDWSLMGDGIYNADPGQCPNPPNNCVFGSSPAHLDAWSKVFLGWVTPQEPLGDLGLTTLSPVETNQQSQPIIKLAASNDPTASGQYFLIENRQKTGYDKGLPGSGLLVWLIDEAVIGSINCIANPNSNFCLNSINNSASHPGIKLVEADGDNALQRYGCSNGGIDCGSPTDPFPGHSSQPGWSPVTNFTPMTTPSSKPYALTAAGSPTAWVNLRNIAESPNVLGQGVSDISVTIGYGPYPPQNVVTSSVDSGNFSWSPYSGDPDPAVSYLVYEYTSTNVSMGVTPTAATQFSDTAHPNLGDVYLIAAVDSAGNESTYADSGIWPAAVVDSPTLTFSTNNSSQVVTVSNASTATASLKISSVTLSGSNAGDFLADENCSTEFLAPGATCSVTVTFSARTTGSKTASLNLVSNDPNNGVKTVTLMASAAQTNSNPGTISSGGGGGGGCFIATAAYGSYLDPHVQVLRGFRDACLLTNGPGKAFVAFYYRWSPPVADFIGRHGSLRAAARWGLTPIVYAVLYPRIAAVVMIGLCLASLMAWRLKRRG